MKRQADMAEISDGKLYESHAMVKAGCSGCGGCCKGMGQSIVLDPLDIFRMTVDLNTTFENLLQDKIELGLVDGVILPHIKMQGNDERCGFLDSENRCAIHGVRPGICRLFPLGRFYENGDFKYFLQNRECKQSPQMKVKIKKWLDEPDLKKQEAFIRRWHYFLLEVQKMLDAQADEGLRKRVTMYVLQSFYLEPFSKSGNFYEAFEKRVLKSESVLNLNSQRRMKDVMD